jgi:hypothetical protein
MHLGGQNMSCVSVSSCGRGSSDAKDVTCRKHPNASKHTHTYAEAEAENDCIRRAKFISYRMQKGTASKGIPLLEETATEQDR